MSPRSPHSLLPFLAAGLLGVTGLHAQEVSQADLAKMLKDLNAQAPQAESQSKAAKLAAATTISTAAQAGDGGVSFWESAIKATEMDGAGQEANNFRLWKESEGDIYKTREVQSAVHLHLEWLAITLQRSSGMTVKELLPSIMAYLQQLWADQVLMAMLEESDKKEKETAPPPAVGRGARNSPTAKALNGDKKTREVHDQILNRALGGSLIVNWMRLREYLGIEGWEKTPGNLDGIYQNIVQPELRAEKDQRVFEYWDTKMKVAAEAASRSKLTFEIEKYNTDVGPSLMFSRAEEYAPLGQKNRAISEMYGILQKYPHHPQAVGWIAALQALLAPPAPDTTTAGTSAGAPAVAPAPAAAVAPQVAVAPAPAPTLAAPAPAPQIPAAPAIVPGPGVSSATLALPGAGPSPAAPGALPGQ